MKSFLFLSLVVVRLLKFWKFRSKKCTSFLKIFNKLHDECQFLQTYFLSCVPCPVQCGRMGSSFLWKMTHGTPTPLQFAPSGSFPLLCWNHNQAALNLLVQFCCRWTINQVEPNQRNLIRVTSKLSNYCFLQWRVEWWGPCYTLRQLGISLRTQLANKLVLIQAVQTGHREYRARSKS